MTTDLPAGTPIAPVRTRRYPWRRIVGENVLVLVVFAVAGALAGWVWERWATVPDGVALDGTWLLGFRPQDGTFVGDNDLFLRAFGVVGTFVVLGLLSGLVIGVLASLVCRSSELATLLAVAAGSVLAAVISYRVGLALGPPDPGAVARKAADGTVIPGNLALAQHSPFVAWPLGSLLGLVAVYLLTSGVSAGMTETSRVDLGPTGPVGPVTSTHSG